MNFDFLKPTKKKVFWVLLWGLIGGSGLVSSALAISRPEDLTIQKLREVLFWWTIIFLILGYLMGDNKRIIEQANRIPF